MMISRAKKTVLFLLGILVWVSSGTALAVLTTEDLTQLKASNLSESVIRLMVENDYDNVDRVVKLKQAGFSDETITSVIRADLKAGSETKQPVLQPEKVEQLKPVSAPADEAKVILQTSAKVTIQQYIGVVDPVVQSGQDIQGATISLLEGRRIKIEWDHSKPSGLLNLFRNKPFASPFYWDLDKDDSLQSVDSKSGSFTLQTGYSHPGEPRVDRSRYWVVRVITENPDLEKRIRELLSK
jgi:hypothetical protein